ncbi:MAG: DUF6498-containing protein [Candidatus Limnocylindrales bacterium]
MTVESLGRAVGLYRRTATSRSAIVLLVANLIPLLGVVFFGWSLLTILVLYWVENGIVGFWNVPKIIMAQGSVIPTLPALPHSAAMAATGSAQAAADLEASWAKARAAQEAQRQALSSTTGTVGSGGGPGSAFGRLASVGRIGMSIFFAFHYGMFWFVHGIFVFALPAFGTGFGTGNDTPCIEGPLEPGSLPGSAIDLPLCANGVFGDVIWSNVLLAAGVLFLSHGASFLFNYIGRGEYLTTSAARQMMSPYGRVVVLHITIIVGSIVAAFLGAPIGALIVLIGLKAAFDLGLHLREHGSSGPPLPSGVASAT